MSIQCFLIIQTCFYFHRIQTNRNLLVDQWHHRSIDPHSDVHADMEDPLEQNSVRDRVEKEEQAEEIPLPGMWGGGIYEANHQTIELNGLRLFH